MMQSTDRHSASQSCLETVLLFNGQDMNWNFKFVDIHIYECIILIILLNNNKCIWNKWLTNDNYSNGEINIFFVQAEPLWIAKYYFLKL